MSQEVTASTGEKVAKGLAVAVIATGGAALTEKAIENNIIPNPLPSTNPIVQTVDAKAETSFTNSKLVDPKNTLPNAIAPKNNANEVQHPPAIKLQPSLNITTTNLRETYDLKKINSKREASVFIVGTKPAENFSSIKETVKFDLIRQNDGEYRVDLGDKVLRKFSSGTSYDYINSKIRVSVQVEMPDSKNTPPIESSSFIVVDFDEVPPSDRVLADKTLANPFKELNIQKLKLKRIQIIDPTTKREIVLDEKYIEENENKESINSLIDLFVKMGNNQPPATPASLTNIVSG